MIKEVEIFITDFIVLPELASPVIALWVAAAWLCDAWDRFPHLSIYSPEKRCGKTRLLDVLTYIVPNPISTSSISPAALYRVIRQEHPRPTIILDEAQFLSRARSESGEVIRELLNAGVERDAKAIRCGGRKMEKVIAYPIYSPKIFAQIGQPDGVLADRSLLIEMKRKTDQDIVRRLRSREVQPRADALRKRLAQWAKEKEELATAFYSVIDPLEIENDRMADLLMPLQTVISIGCEFSTDTLSAYALSLEERGKRQESQSAGIRLLAACRAIFDSYSFISTSRLIEKLTAREEDPWHRWNRGEGLNPESLARLLRSYGIRSQHNKTRTKRGYFASDFADSWGRYLPPLPLKKPSSLSKVSTPSKLSTHERDDP